MSGSGQQTYNGQPPYYYGQNGQQINPQYGQQMYPQYGQQGTPQPYGAQQPVPLGNPAQSGPFTTQPQQGTYGQQQTGGGMYPQPGMFAQQQPTSNPNADALRMPPPPKPTTKKPATKKPTVPPPVRTSERKYISGL